jgi:hypothetical protein
MSLAMAMSSMAIDNLWSGWLHRLSAVVAILRLSSLTLTRHIVLHGRIVVTEQCVVRVHRVSH